MKKYSAYKPSNNYWIGELPREWQLKKLKYVIEGKLKYGANESAELDDQSLPRYIRITDFRDDGKLREDTFKSLSLDKAENYFLEEGDILFARSGATVGKTFQFKDYKGLACFAGYLIKAKPDQKIILSDFLYYMTKSNYYDNWKESVFIQATIQNIGADKYSNFILPVPSINEQNIIVHFLNKQTEKIDKLISNKQKLIDLYKKERIAVINKTVLKGINPDTEMKYSGIDWLGDIPIGWEVKRLKYVSNTRISNVDKKSEDEIIVSLCNYMDVYKNDFIDNTLEFMQATATPSQIVNFELKLDDVLITKDSETSDDIGIPAYVSLVNTKGIICGYHLAQITTNKDVLFGKYLFRLLQASNYKDYFDMSSKGVTRFGLGTYSIINLFVPLPSIEEQHSISNFLDREISKIDKAIWIVEQQISSLKEYRTALISEVVTGKIDVRDEVVSWT